MPRKAETRGRKKKYTTKRQREKAVSEQNNKWKKEHTRCINVRYHLVYDQDILNKLDSVKSKADYIRQLIRKDIDNNLEG